MTATVTATYSTIEQARNLKDDLRSTGIPAEKIFIDEPAHKIRVIAPTATQPNIVEFFERHKLTAVTH